MIKFGHFCNSSIKNNNIYTLFYLNNFFVKNNELPFVIHNRFLTDLYTAVVGGYLYPFFLADSYIDFKYTFWYEEIIHVNKTFSAILFCSILD